MSNKQIQEIFQYIQSEGNSLSEKVLKQIQKHPDTLWELIVKLCSRLKNKNIQCAYAQLIFTLSQPDKHDRSSKWLREYMNIRDIAAKFGMNYTVMDFFKPQKQKALIFVAKIVDVNKGLQQVTKEIDVLMTRDQTLDKELIKVKNLKETITKELDELREKKKSQLPTFQALNKETQQVNQQINYMRQLKLDLISGQKQLFEDQKQKQNYFQNLEYLNSIAQIQIEGMKKAVAQNAPEVKKQRRAIEEEYHRVHNQVNFFAQMVKKRQEMALSALQQRQKIKENVLTSIQRLKEELKLVKIEQRQQRQIQNDRQKVQRLLNRSQKTITEIRNKQKNLDTEINKIKTSEQTHSKYLQRDTILHQQKIQQVEEIKNEIELGKQKIEKGAKVFDSIKSKIFEASSYRETTINRLNMEKQKWLEKCLSELKETYSIFNLERILKRLNLTGSN